MHLICPFSSVHVPPFRQGFGVQGFEPSGSVPPLSQKSPEKPSRQLQVGIFPKDTHDPPFSHGFGRHGLRKSGSGSSTSHSGPEKPSRQLHRALVPCCMHVAAFLHGLGSQGSKTPSDSSSSQNIPVKPCMHRHRTSPPFGQQSAPF